MKTLKPITEFKDLVGHTLTAVENSGSVMEFTTSEGEKYKLYHDQDCCESVRVEDVCGDLNDLIGEPLLQAEEASNEPAPESYKPEYQPESCTWTFYRMATIKGAVVIRWLGESNGYYCERVDFAKVN